MPIYYSQDPWGYWNETRWAPSRIAELWAQDDKRAARAHAAEARAAATDKAEAEAAAKEAMRVATAKEAAAKRRDAARKAAKEAVLHPTEYASHSDPVWNSYVAQVGIQPRKQ